MCQRLKLNFICGGGISVVGTLAVGCWEPLHIDASKKLIKMKWKMDESEEMNRVQRAWEKES